MINRQDIIDQARSMIGTPWRHQGRQPGEGLDCIGLIVCVMRNLGVTITDNPTYGRAPIPSQFIEAVRAHVPEKPIVCKEPGDMLLIAPGKVLQHACIYLGNDMIIHAQDGSVVSERRLDDWEYRIRYCFDLSNPL